MDLMLGIDWLQENITWNFNKGEIYLAGETFKLRSRRSQQPYCRTVVLMENVTVPPRSQLDVPVKAVFDDIRTAEDYKSGTWGTEATELRGLLAARTLLPDRLDDLPVRLLNTTNESIQLEKDTNISPVVPLVTASAQVQQPTNVKAEATEESIISDLISGVDPSINDDIKDKLKSILSSLEVIGTSAGRISLHMRLTQETAGRSDSSYDVIHRLI